MICNVNKKKTSPLPSRIFPQTSISDRANYNETNKGAERLNKMIAGVTT